MADLKCTVDNCVYNSQHLCSKGDIMVGGKHACKVEETCCESFDQRREGHDSFKNSTCHPTKTISIDCEAVKCMYNDNDKCKAKKVDILGNGAMNREGTLCGTYREQ